MDHDKDGKVNIDEFINYYIEGELKIKHRYNNCIKLMAERIERREQTTARLEVVR